MIHWLELHIPHWGGGGENLNPPMHAYRHGGGITSRGEGLFALPMHRGGDKMHSPPTWEPPHRNVCVGGGEGGAGKVWSAVWEFYPPKGGTPGNIWAAGGVLVQPLPSR